MPSYKHSPSKLTLWFLILVFTGPMIGARLLYAHQDKIRFKTTQNGILFSPPREAKELTTDRAFEGKWQLIYLSPSACKTNCQTAIQELHHIHQALGKDQPRVILRIVPRQAVKQSLPDLKSDEIIILDPKGWLVLKYSNEQDKKGILRDFRQLLRLSHA